MRSSGPKLVEIIYYLLKSKHQRRNPNQRNKLKHVQAPRLPSQTTQNHPDPLDHPRSLYLAQHESRRKYSDIQAVLRDRRLDIHGRLETVNMPSCTLRKTDGVMG